MVTSLDGHHPSQWARIAPRKRLTWAQVEQYAEAFNLKLVSKADSRLMLNVGRAARLIGVDFVNDFHTTLGRTIYFTPWSFGRDYKIRVDLLEHERQHADDMSRWGIVFYATYGAANLGIFIGPGMRAFWEWRGYRHNIRAMARIGVPLSGALAYAVPNFTGRAYGFMLWRSATERLVRNEYARMGVR